MAPKFPDDFKRVTFEIRTVERVMRTYYVTIPVHPNEAEEDLKAQAEAKLMGGGFDNVIDSDADIEEVLSVERQRV